MTDLVDEGKAMMSFCLGFKKTFDTLSLSNPIDKLMKYNLDKWTVRWTKKYLNC